MSKLAPTCSSKDADPRARTKVQPRWILLVSTLVLGLAPCQTLSAETGVAASPDTAAPHKPQPLFEFRELYALGHFGNSYEVMGNDEFRSVFAENKFWGFNSYADWFNTDDCKDPFASGHTYGLGDAQWDAKKEHLAIVQRLGLLRTLELHPNHVYITQCLPGLLATRAAPNSSQVVHGQLICPSIPAARAMILKNHENMFADLARSGVRLDRLMACPYDFGGCRCKKCDPWILTFAKLTHEIYQIARKYHPHVKMNMMGWWWKPEEHRLFAEWADKNAPGWVDIMQLQVLYGETRTSDLPLPKGCRRGAFIHIGYAEEKAPLDIYDHFGPVIAADRIERTVANLKAQGTVGFSAYSEGNYADVNCACWPACQRANIRRPTKSWPPMPAAISASMPIPRGCGRPG